MVRDLLLNDWKEKSAALPGHCPGGPVPAAAYVCPAKMIIAKLRQSFVHETMKHNNQDDLLLVFYTQLLLVAESVKSKSNDFRDDLEILVNATRLLLVGVHISLSIV